MQFNQTRSMPATRTGSAVTVENCAICQEPLTQNVAKLHGCPHQFHRDCIDSWKNITNQCPLCKKRFNYIECNGHRIKCKKLDQKNEDPLTEDYLNELAEQPCQICGSTDLAEYGLLCDGCDACYHTHCIGLEEIPDGDWYCDTCAHLPRSRRSRRRSHWRQDNRYDLNDTMMSQFESNPDMIHTQDAEYIPEDDLHDDDDEDDSYLRELDASSENNEEFAELKENEIERDLDVFKFESATKKTSTQKYADITPVIARNRNRKRKRFLVESDSDLEVDIEAGNDEQNKKSPVNFKRRKLKSSKHESPIQGLLQRRARRTSSNDNGQHNQPRKRQRRLSTSSIEILQSDSISPVEWKCSVCTFLNHSKMDQCEMCETQRKTDDGQENGNKNKKQTESKAKSLSLEMNDYFSESNKNKTRNIKQMLKKNNSRNGNKNGVKYTEISSSDNDSDLHDFLRHSNNANNHRKRKKPQKPPQKYSKSNPYQKKTDEASSTYLAFPSSQPSNSNINGTLPRTRGDIMQRQKQKVSALQMIGEDILGRFDLDENFLSLNSIQNDNKSNLRELANSNQAGSQNQHKGRKKTEDVSEIEDAEEDMALPPKRKMKYREKAQRLNTYNKYGGLSLSASQDNNSQSA